MSGETNFISSDSIFLIILGWLFGLLSPSIIDSIKNRRRNIEIRKAIISELNEVRFLLAGTIYILSNHSCTHNRKELELLVQIFEKYNGPDPSDIFLSPLKDLLSKNDVELAACNEEIKAKPMLAALVKKHRVPYLELHLTNIGIFNVSTQSLLINVRGKVDIYNEMVDDARFYYKLTYEPGVSPENHLQAQNALKNQYQHLKASALLIIDRINKIAPL